MSALFCIINTLVDQHTPLTGALDEELMLETTTVTNQIKENKFELKWVTQISFAEINFIKILKYTKKPCK